MNNSRAPEAAETRATLDRNESLVKMGEITMGLVTDLPPEASQAVFAERL